MHVLRLIHVPPFRQFGKHRAAKGEREKKTSKSKYLEPSLLPDKYGSQYIVMAGLTFV